MARPKNKFERRLVGRQKAEVLYNRIRNIPYLARVKFIIRGENGERRFLWERPEGKEYTVVRWNHANRAGVKSPIKWVKKRSRRKVRRTKGKFSHGLYRKVFDLWWTLY